MRSIHSVWLASAAVLWCTGLHAANDGYELPVRKAGLWQVRTATDEGRGATTQNLKMCIGEQLEKVAIRASTAENRANCATYEIEKTPAAIVVDASCTYDERLVATHTELQGDFQTSFVAVVVSSVTGKAPRAMGGQPVDVQRNIRQEGTYLGEDCGALQPGEAETEAGRTVRVQ